MKRDFPCPPPVRPLALAWIFAATLVLAPAAWPDQTSTNTVPSKAKVVEKNRRGAAKKTAPLRQLSGAELYSMHCNRCHPERYPTERTAAQWKTILMHMRVRANLPAEQARTILKYLQDNSGR